MHLPDAESYANRSGFQLELNIDIHPDLILMDLKMPKMNGIQATKIIREQFPEVRVLVLTTYDVDEWVIDAIRNGAAGYLMKDTPQEDLVKNYVSVIFSKLGGSDRTQAAILAIRAGLVDPREE